MRRAINEGRLRVDAESGRVYHRRPYPKAVWRETKQEIVIPRNRKDGYARVQFSSSKGRRSCLVHRLVWMSENGSIRRGLTVNHIDGDKLNNSIGNLELATKRQNTRMAIEAGLYDPRAPKGRHDGFCSKLSADKAREIRRMAADGHTQRDIAEKFGVSQSHVSKLLSGHRFAWAS